MNEKNMIFTVTQPFFQPLLLQTGSRRDGGLYYYKLVLTLFLCLTFIISVFFLYVSIGFTIFVGLVHNKKIKMLHGLIYFIRAVYDPTPAESRNVGVGGKSYNVHVTAVWPKKMR